ncbi:hypothetical protein G6L37_01025 [Agrobacterium rubi]|nr:hypothetical protein [Agrobacterium rubi]NTF23974.1 hypothetical protein [Agrobacterium rubi]
MCSLIEPVMLGSLIVAPFAATFVFGATPSLSLHFALVMLGTWAGGLVVLPLIVVAIVLAFGVPIMLAVALFKKILPADKKV